MFQKLQLWRTMERNERQMLSAYSSCVCSFVAAFAHWPVKVKPALMTLHYAEITLQGAKRVFLLFLQMQRRPRKQRRNKNEAAAAARSLGLNPLVLIHSFFLQLSELLCPILSL